MDGSGGRWVDNEWMNEWLGDEGCGWTDKCLGGRQMDGGVGEWKGKR
jgi:hypothetical protein